MPMNRGSFAMTLLPSLVCTAVLGGKNSTLVVQPKVLPENVREHLLVFFPLLLSLVRAAAVRIDLQEQLPGGQHSRAHGRPTPSRRPALRPACPTAPQREHEEGGKNDQGNRVAGHLGGRVAGHLEEDRPHNRQGCQRGLCVRFLLRG